MAGLNDDGHSERSVSPPLTLDPNTLAVLNSFLLEREEDERLFHEATEQSNGDGLLSHDPDQDAVGDFRKLYPEDWKLSQFWLASRYSPDTNSPISQVFDRFRKISGQMPACPRDSHRLQRNQLAAPA